MSQERGHPARIPSAPSEFCRGRSVGRRLETLMELNVFNGDFACGLWKQCGYPQDWKTAAEAWRLFVRKDAAAMRELAAREGAWERLPKMQKALLRCAEEFPDGNGLTRTQRQLLEIVSSGLGIFPEIFKGLDAFEEYPFLGDTACERHLEALVRKGFLVRCGERYELSRSAPRLPLPPVTNHPFTKPLLTTTGETP